MVSFRGLTDSGFDSPLRDFRGTFDSWAVKEDTRFDRTRVVVQLNFKDVEVLESVEPWEFPIATIEIGHSNRKRSRWGVLAESALKFIPDGDIGDLVGHTLRMKVTPGHMLYDGRQGKEVPTEAWEIIEIDGRGSGKSAQVTIKRTPEQAALQILHGKTLAEFNQQVLRDPDVRTDSNLLLSIINNTWVQSQIAAGNVTVDSSGIHFVKGM
jgi:hypothetical protein